MKLHDRYASCILSWEEHCWTEISQRVGENQQAFHAYLKAIADAPERVRDIIPYAHNLLDRDTVAAESDWLLHGWADEIERTKLGDDDQATVTLFLGRIDLYLGNYTRALKLFQDAQQIFRHDARAVEGIGKALWRVGDFDQAVSKLNEARELARHGSHPERLAAIDTALIEALVDNGQYDEALSRIESKLAEGGSYTYELLLTRSQCYLALGRADEALEIAKSASERSSTAVRAHLLRAQALIALKRYREAVNAADQALQNDPSNPEVLLYKAQALTEGQIDFDQAQRLLKRYIGIVGNEKVMNQVLSPVFTAWSEDGDSHYFLAQLYHMLGNPEEALREVNRALELGLSGSDHFPEARAQQLKAELLEAEGEREEATKWFYEAGRNFYWQNEHQIAVDLLTRARDLNQELNRDHAPTRWYLADAWRMNSYRLKPPHIDEGTVKKGLAISIWESGIEIEMPSSDDS